MPKRELPSRGDIGKYKYQHYYSLAMQRGTLTVSDPDCYRVTAEVNGIDLPMLLRLIHSLEKQISEMPFVVRNDSTYYNGHVFIREELDRDASSEPSTGKRRGFWNRLICISAEGRALRSCWAKRDQFNEKDMLRLIERMHTNAEA